MLARRRVAGSFRRSCVLLKAGIGTQELKTEFGAKRGGTMGVGIIVIMMVLTNTAGALLVSRGMKQVGEISTLQPRELLKIFRHGVLKNYLVILGFLSQVCTFFLFLAALNLANLSWVIPMGALGYLVSVLGAKLFLKEQFTKERWIGTVIIGIGVVLVSL
ncbi:MAG: hypothetical protein BRC52_16120 [Cyanobacteria bacterium SW_5_48_44]|nr:MAG: hypothetical protein BRC52_16120 [Cyanobacteria bacterium SW_5_48_44]